MDPIKSLDEFELIANVLRDVSSTHRSWFSTVSCEQTISKVRQRLNSEGVGFLTKTMPSLGKALDCALSSGQSFDPTDYGFTPAEGGMFPQFMGEFFERVLSASGTPLVEGCAISVRVLRQVLYLFYKYELPYTSDQEQAVLTQFERTETELIETDKILNNVQDWISWSAHSPVRRLQCPQMVRIARTAQATLRKLFKRFDILDIKPSHGPGAVSTGEKPWEKYDWKCVPSRLTDLYPLDAYFCASLGHVCDVNRQWSSLDDRSEPPARVCLVPKDSRGPRLISCEPPALQWIQQGQRKAIYKLVETHPLTRWNVFFTNQVPNQCAAIVGSDPDRYGAGEGYATIDLKEASDRVSLELVRLLFPSWVVPALEASRSLATKLPCGRIITLRKFAPMGSANCFPIMALTIWSLLHAALSDTDTRESILVYGDDVVVPRRVAGYAIAVLEAFGLIANRSKCCLEGSFRESCGMDAYKGLCVTPIRLRTVWTHHPSAESFESWVAYANSFYKKGFYNTYDYIVRALRRLYWPIASGKENTLGVPTLIGELTNTDTPTRTNKRLQRREWYATCVIPHTIRKPRSGWSMLLRYFVSAQNVDPDPVASRLNVLSAQSVDQKISSAPFSVSLYTERRSGMLGRRWLGAYGPLVEH